MPTSGSASRSIATRCSALRPARRTGPGRRGPGAPACRRAPGRAPDCEPLEGDAGVARQVPGLVEVDHALGEQLVDHRRLDLELGEAGPGLVVDLLVAVLVGVQADDARLQAQRQVLGDHDDVVALDGQVVGDGEDAVVVVVGPQRRRQRRRSWWLSSTRSVPPRSLTGIGLGERAVSRRGAARGVRSASRAAHPSSGWLRFASSSISTTIGSTTSCSSKRTSARGSASSTEVSST